MAALSWETLAERAGVPLDAAARERLRAYGRLLAEANARVNLTRITSEEELLEKHLLDALLGLPLLGAGAGARLVDVGSGGGVPGVPLAVVRPDWEVTLVEATARKAAALAELVGELGLERVRVVAQRAEELGHTAGEREAYDVATLRAVGAAATCLELALPLVRPGGEVLLYRGPAGAEAEAEAIARVAPRLGGGAARAVARELPSGAGRRLVLVPKVAATPRRYPRRAGVPAKRPLS